MTDQEEYEKFFEMNRGDDVIARDNDTLPLNRKELVAAALLNAKEAVEALENNKIFAADIFLKVAIDYLSDITSYSPPISTKR